MSDRSQNENIIQKLAIGKSFRLISSVQMVIHLCAYVAAFVKIIIIEAGGYYDIGAIVFIGMTLGSMPLFAIALWLIKNSLKISKRQRIFGCCAHLITSIWSMFIIKVSYFM
jgi:hypothetical protein